MALWIGAFGGLVAMAIMLTDLSRREA
jgi:hypothetical protein